MRTIVVIAHNIRSTQNVGSILRTAEGLGIKQVYLTGYTPYPKLKDDKRLPHLVNKQHRQIVKTSLGAETKLEIKHSDEIESVVDQLKKNGCIIAALEQTDDSLSLVDYKPPPKIALILGNELDGIDAETLGMCDAKLEIPMRGKKESFNVSVACGIALYHLAFY